MIYRVELLSEEELNFIAIIRNKHIRYCRQAFPLNKNHQKDWFNNTSDIYYAIYQDEIPYKFRGAIGITCIDLISKKAELSFIVDDYENLDNYSDCLNTVYIQCFEKLNLNKLFCIVYKYDKYKQKLFNKIKWNKEAILKDDVCYNNKFYDSILYTYYEKDYKKEIGLY